MDQLKKRLDAISAGLDHIVEKAQLWQSIVDESPMGIAVFTSDFRFFIVNRSFYELTGYDHGELDNKRMSTLIPQKFRRIHKKYEKEFSQDPEQRIDRKSHQQILCKDGSILPVSIDLSFIRYNGKVYYIIFVRRI